MSIFHKKQYEKIAAILASHPTVVDDFIIMFEEDNPNFKIELKKGGEKE